MLGVNIVAADTDDEARRLFTSHQQIFLALRRGTLGPVPPPLDADEFDASLTPLERAELQHVLGSAIVGSPVNRAARPRASSSSGPAPTKSSWPARSSITRRGCGRMRSSLT